MTASEQVADHVSEWEIGGQTAIDEINKIVIGIGHAIQELDSIGIDFSDLEELQEAFKQRISWYEND